MNFLSTLITLIAILALAMTALVAIERTVGLGPTDGQLEAGV